MRPVQLHLLLLVALALPLLGLWARDPSAHAAASGPGTREIPGPLGPGTAELTATDEELNTPPVALVPGEAPGRRKAAAPPPPPPEEAAGPVPDVAGVVVDHLGRPLAGVVVRLQQDRPSAELDAEYGGFFLLSSGGPGRRGPSSLARTTDERGQFLFDGSPSDCTGKLRYGERLFHGPSLIKPVEAGEWWSELTLPDPAALTGHVVLHVRTPDGASVELEEVEVAHVTAPEGTRTPSAGTFPPELAHGRADLWLGVGTWDVLVGALRGEARTARVVVAEPGAEVEQEVVLGVWSDAHVERFEGALDVDGLPPLDPSNGIVPYLSGVKRMPYDAKGWDRHFAQTLSFGSGPVRAATLTLRLRSINGMSTNDGLYLEYVGERRFRWSNHIRALPGVGPWGSGARTTVTVDLARLPGARREVNLLDDLEDGLLDVMIQDDTAVLGLDLRVVR